MSNNPDGFAAAQYRPGSRRDHPAVVLEHSFRRPKLVGRQRWSQQSRLDALAKSSIKEGFRALLAQEVRFATDSPLEGTGFEPSVPPPNIRHSDVPHRFSNGSDSDWPPGRESGAQCAGCTSCADQDNGAICLESCWGKCIRIRCFHTEDRAVACQRCSCDRLGIAHSALSRTLGVQIASGLVLRREAQQ